MGCSNKISDMLPTQQMLNWTPICDMGMKIPEDEEPFCFSFIFGVIYCITPSE